MGAYGTCEIHGSRLWREPLCSGILGSLELFSKLLGASCCCLNMGVLVSYYCCKKLPQIWWPKTPHMYSLTVLEVRRQKSVSLDWNQGVSRASIPLGALGENLFPASSSFWWVLEFCGLWLQHSNLCLFDYITLSSSVCLVSLCIPLIRIQGLAFRVYWDNSG